MTKKEMPPKSELFKLKEWLTLKDTAQYLSVLFKEDVSEADVLRLGLDGRLKLSVNILNNEAAKPGKVVSYENVEWYTPEELSDGNLSHYMLSFTEDGRAMKSVRIDGQRYLNLSEGYIYINGIWDLIMIYNVSRYLENRYQELTGGPYVANVPLRGIYLEKDGLVRQLLKSYDGEEEELLSTYCYTKVLPSDSLLVVRTQALIDLKESFSSEETTRRTQPGAPYLDKSHMYHAKELMIAVEAWTDLYEKNPPTNVPKGGHKNYINRWLRKNYPELAVRAKERIATIINPNPKGGASPITDP
jgi:hypothetical protein